MSHSQKYHFNKWLSIQNITLLVHNQQHSLESLEISLRGVLAWCMTIQRPFQVTGVLTPTWTELKIGPI